MEQTQICRLSFTIPHLFFCRNLFPPNIVQATMFQYRTHLEPPLNATAELANGTKIYISDLSSEVRNRFTVSKYKLTNFEGKEG